MEIGEIIKVRVIANGAFGEGIANANDYTIFVPLVLQNEVAEIEITKLISSKKIAFARVIKLIEKDKNRVDSACQYYYSCGGCSYLHTTYNKQLELKTNAVKTTISKFVKNNFKVQNAVPSDNVFQFRNKVEFNVNNGQIGFYENNSHKIVQIDKCLLCNDWCERFLKVARELVKQTSDLFYIIVRNLDLNNENLSILLVFNKYPKFDEKLWITGLQTQFSNFSLHTVISESASEIYSKKIKTLYGEGLQTLVENGISLKVSPYSFLQTNSNVQNKIYNEIFNNIEPNSFIINAYSGAGFLTAKLAQKASFVYGIEISESASCDANKLMIDNSIKNVENICGDCKNVLPKLLNSINKEKHDTTFVINPPRNGVEDSALLSILHFAPNKIIYISCNPATLGRDLKKMQQNYEIQLIQPYDMFPWTKHIETLVILTKKT